MSGTFGAESTTDEVLAGKDLSGQRVLVTGVSAGLGVETLRALAAHGAEVTGAARDLDKARQALGEASVPAGTYELTEVDLASLASVRACADRLLAADRPFDVIVANAGIMACPQATTVDGFERQFGVNHLGHFVLVNRLAPLLRSGGRLVNVSSAGHRFSDVDLEDPGFARTPYDPLVAYGRAKTSNILFAVEFDRRHRGRGVRATALHPGGIHTELGRYMEPAVQETLMAMSQKPRPADAPVFNWKTVPQGAATQVWAGFVAPADLVGARYCEDCHVAEVITNPAYLHGVRPYALDPERAKALWALSEKMVGEAF